MDVGRALVGGLADHRVDEPDDRRVLGVGDEEVRRLVVLEVGRVVDPALHARPRPDAVGGLEQLRRVGDDRDDLAVGDHLEVVEREHVGRVGDRDAQHAVLLLDRDRAVAARDLLGDALGDDLVDRRRVEVHERHAEPLGEDLGRVDRGDELELDQDLAEPAAGAALDVERLGELLVGDHPVLDEQVADAAADRRGRQLGSTTSWITRPCIDPETPGLRAFCIR